MKWLVTGVSGFLGAAFGEAVISAGHEVVGLGRGSERPAHWPGAYRPVDFRAIDLLAGELREFAPDAVAHFAGSASVGESFQSPAEDFEASTGLWFRLLEATRQAGIRPLVALASSAAVYGSPEILPTPERAPSRPESPYGFHKLLSEQIAEEYARCFGFPVVSLRFFSVFGPRQRRLLVWEIFEQLCRGVEELRLKGTGEEQRDFLSAGEAAAAAVAALGTLADEGAGFQAVNIASGTSVSVREVAETLRDCVGSTAKIVFGHEDLRGNPARWQADIGRLRQLAPGWHPKSFSASIKDCADGWKAEVAEFAPSSLT